MSNHTAGPATLLPVRYGPMYLTAFFGALIFPGLGQVLTGRMRRGLLWLTLVWAAIVCTVGVIMLRAHPASFRARGH